MITYGLVQTVGPYAHPGPQKYRRNNVVEERPYWAQTRRLPPNQYEQRLVTDLSGWQNLTNQKLQHTVKEQELAIAIFSQPFGRIAQPVGGQVVGAPPSVPPTIPTLNSPTESTNSSYQTAPPGTPDPYTVQPFPATVNPWAESGFADDIIQDRMEQRQEIEDMQQEKVELMDEYTQTEQRANDAIQKLEAAEKLKNYYKRKHEELGKEFELWKSMQTNPPSTDPSTLPPDMFEHAKEWERAHMEQMAQIQYDLMEMTRRYGEASSAAEFLRGQSEKLNAWNHDLQKGVMNTVEELEKTRKEIESYRTHKEFLNRHIADLQREIELLSQNGHRPSLLSQTVDVAINTSPTSTTAEMGPSNRIKIGSRPPVPQHQAPVLGRKSSSEEEVLEYQRTGQGRKRLNRFAPPPISTSGSSSKSSNSAEIHAAVAKRRGAMIGSASTGQGSWSGRSSLRSSWSPGTRSTESYRPSS